MTSDLLQRTLPLLLAGAYTTIKVLLCCASVSLGLGTLWGVISCERWRVPLLSSALEALTFILRAVPFFVQLLIFYFVIPDLLGLNLEIFSASVLSLGACSAGYTCQIIRGGLNTIPAAQWETAFVLGYSKLQALWYIIFPQVFRNVLPALNNEMESILKSTAILSSIGMLELTRMGMNIVSRELKEPLAIYLLVAAMYVSMSWIFHFFAKNLENRKRL